MNAAIAREAEVAANALGAAIHGRDVAAIRSLYADDIIVWHGSTNQAQTKDENSNLLAAVFSITSRLEYVDVRRHAIEGGLFSSTAWLVPSTTAARCPISMPVS
jgi:ketosteroid isomerase-like protein